VEPAYRDDNLGLWIPADAPPEANSETILEAARVEKSETEPPRGDEPNNQPANATRPAAPGDNTGLPIATYPEWDFLIRHARPNWTTVRAYPPKPGRKADIDSIIGAHAPLAQKLSALIRTARVSRPRRLRHQAEGDALDLDSCIPVHLHADGTPKPRPRYPAPARRFAIHQRPPA
jgi:hypothetical protein